MNPSQVNSKPTSLQVVEIPAKPKPKSQVWGSPLSQETPTTQEQLQKQTEAIKSGEYKLANVPCKPVSNTLTEKLGHVQ